MALNLLQEGQPSDRPAGMMLAGLSVDLTSDLWARAQAETLASLFAKLDCAMNAAGTSALDEVARAGWSRQVDEHGPSVRRDRRTDVRELQGAVRALGTERAGRRVAESASIVFALAWLEAINATLVRAGLGMESPHVTASVDGDVVLEWWSDDRKLTVYLSGSVAEYVKVWGPDIDSEMEDGALTSANAVEVWAWLRAARSG